MREIETEPPSKIEVSERDSRTLRCNRVNSWDIYWGSFRNVGVTASLGICGSLGSNSLPIYKTVDMVRS